VYPAARHRPVKRFRSGTDGRFRVRLQPGRYTLTGANSGYPHAAPVAVRIQAHRFTSLIIRFDTGIR
jgi:hypothetical protein